jgi:hypothetical protein
MFLQGTDGMIRIHSVKCKFQLDKRYMKWSSLERIFLQGREYSCQRRLRKNPHHRSNSGLLDLKFVQECIGNNIRMLQKESRFQQRMEYKRWNY